MYPALNKIPTPHYHALRNLLLSFVLLVNFTAAAQHTVATDNYSVENNHLNDAVFAQEQFTNQQHGWLTADRALPHHSDALNISAENPTTCGTYISYTTTVSAGNFQSAQVLFRCHGEQCSSGAFFGNYLQQLQAQAQQEQPLQFSWTMRHNASRPLHAFIRFARGLNFPGAVSGKAFLQQLSPHQWQTATIKISVNQFESFSGTSFATVFYDIGRIQIGIDTRGHTEESVRFDLCNVTYHREGM